MIKYLTLEEVLKMHDAFIERFGGLSGVRDGNLLSSAVETPKMAMFGEDLYLRQSMIKLPPIYTTSSKTTHLLTQTKELGLAPPTYF